MKKTLIILVVLIALSAGVWLYLRSKKITSKEKAMAVIAEYTGLGTQAYASLGEEYLIARATAIQKGNETFMDQGNTYLTATGKRVV